jgi:hypothetical protein
MSAPAAKIIRKIIEGSVITIDNQKIKDAEKEEADDGEVFEDWIVKLINKHIHWFFERD